MSISRKIYFREMGSWISQGADALDRFESDSRNILRAQPLQNRSALERDRQGAQFFHAKMVLVTRRNPRLIINPVLFFGCDRCCAPDAWTNFSTERFLQIRNNAAPQPIAQRTEIFIGGVFAKFQRVFAHIDIDLITPR